MSVGRNIVSLLPKIGPKHQYLMIVPKGLNYDLHEEAENVTAKEIAMMKFSRRIRFDLLDLPKLTHNFQSDITLGLGNMGLSNPKCKQAILFHQPHLIYDSKYFGEMSFFERIKIPVLIKQRLRKCLKHTNMVFCQTPVARERFSRVFKYPIDQIKIMPNAVSEFTKIDQASTEMPSIFRASNITICFF